MQTRTLAARMASRLAAIAICKRTENLEWLEKHSEALAKLSDTLPHGSGLNGTVSLDVERSTPNRLVIVAEFHHMDEYGYYDGWTSHDVIVTPTFLDLNVRVTGRNRNDIKDYLCELFHSALSETSEAF